MSVNPVITLTAHAFGEARHSGCMAPPEAEREWNPDKARRERVPGRRDLLTKARREELSCELIALETGEYISDDALEELRRFKRDNDVVLFVSDDLDDDTREVVEQSFRYLGRRLEDAAADDVQAVQVPAREVQGPDV